jgi:hypothetical protein
VAPSAKPHTPGYSRRVVDLGVPPTDQHLNAGGGVEILGIRRLRDRLFGRRLFDQEPEQHRQQAIADSLSLVDVGLGPPESSLNQRLTSVGRRPALRLVEYIGSMTQADAAHRAALGALANTGHLSLMDDLT